LNTRRFCSGSENLLKRSDAQLEKFLNHLLACDEIKEVHFLWRPQLPDPNDDLVLELAVAASARYIITYNLRDFRGSERWGVALIVPAEFLRTI
jgi:predicted nucleic acid-binding protein